VLTLGGESSPRGKIVAVTHAGLDPLFGCRFAVEQLIAIHESRPEVEVVALVRRRAVSGRRTFFDALTADDVRRGYVDEHDVYAISALPRLLPEGTLDGEPDVVWSRLLQRLDHASLMRPTTVSWRTGPDARAWQGEWIREPSSDAQPPRTPPGEQALWLRNALAALPAALPWRLTGNTGPLFREQAASSLIPLEWAADRHGGKTLFRRDRDPVPTGVEVGSAACALVAHEAIFTAPVLRTVEETTGRRGLAVGSPPEGWLPEAVLGYAELLPLPGTQPLVAPDAEGGSTRAARVYPPDLVEESGVGSAGPLLNARRWWRGVDFERGHHLYDTSAARLGCSCLLEGPVCVLATAPGSSGDAHAVYSLFSPDERVPCGFTARREHLASRLRTGEIVGWLWTEPKPGTRPVRLQRQKDTGDLLCSNLAGEGAEAGYQEVEIVGYGWC
jgi:hypothetical protein